MKTISHAAATRLGSSATPFARSLSTSAAVALAAAAFAALATGCAGAAGDGTDPDSSPDQAGSSYSLSGYSPLTAAAITAVATGASRDTLVRSIADGGVGLRASAADGIVGYRNGPDGVGGTDDDRAIVTLKELDAVPGVGPVSIEHLRTFALAEPVPSMHLVGETASPSLAQLLQLERGHSASGWCSGTGARTSPSPNCQSSDAAWSGTANVTYRLNVTQGQGPVLFYGEGFGFTHDRDAIEIEIDAFNTTSNGNVWGVAHPPVRAPIRFHLGSMASLDFVFPYYMNSTASGSVRLGLKDGALTFATSASEDDGGGSRQCSGVSMQYTCDARVTGTP